MAFTLSVRRSPTELAKVLNEGDRGSNLKLMKPPLAVTNTFTGPLVCSFGPNMPWSTRRLELTNVTEPVSVFSKPSVKACAKS